MRFVRAQDLVKQYFPNEINSDKLEFEMYPNPHTGGALYFISSPSEIKNIIILDILG